MSPRTVAAMKHRMFVAVLPPDGVREQLDQFLEPRPGLSWTASSQWHLTLTFCSDVDDWRLDEFTDRLGAVARKHEPFRMRLAGAGAFPSVERAKVLWAGVDQPAHRPLHALADGARSAASASGCVPDGARFRPHLTLARLSGRRDATAWLRVLDTFGSSDWEVAEVVLVDSFLGEGPRGRARHEVLARLPLGRQEQRWWDAPHRFAH